MRLWLAVGPATVVAVVSATGALGVTGNDRITTIAGSGQAGFSGDGGPATAARLNQPWWVAVDAKRNVYVAEFKNHRLRKVSAAGKITTIAATGKTGYSGDGAPATRAQLNSPWSVAVDGSGNVYITEYHGHRVRKVSPGGTITTFAGTGVRGYSGDGGPATSATLGEPYGVAADRHGSVYIAEHVNMTVRRVDLRGRITTFAGSGKLGLSGDGGPATSATFRWPYGVAVDRQGNVCVADYYNNRVRKITAGGTITTIAGSGPVGAEARFSGDGGPATKAHLNKPAGVAVDGQGNVYVVDRNNHRLRRIDRDGTITTIAGTGKMGFGGDGCPARSGVLFGPFGVAVDPQGNVYIADTDNHRVRRIGRPTA